MRTELTGGYKKRDANSLKTIKKFEGQISSFFFFFAVVYFSRCCIDEDIPGGNFPVTMIPTVRKQVFQTISSGWCYKGEQKINKKKKIAN